MTPVITGKVYQLWTMGMRAALLRNTMMHIVYKLIDFSRNDNCVYI